MTRISPLANFFVTILGLGLVLLVPSTVAFVAHPSTQLDIRRADSRWQQGVDRPRSSRPPLPLSMMAEKKNRKARRLAEAQQKKNKKPGSSKGASQPTRSASDAKWLQVLDSASEIQAGSVKVVSAKYKGDEKFFALATHAGKYFAVSEGCGRCKFPMVNGKVKVLVGPGKTEDIKEGDQQDPEAKVVLVCPLCGAFFDVSTGAIAGEQTTGLVSSFVSKLVSQTAPESLKSYQAKALSTGALVVRVD